MWASDTSVSSTNVYYKLKLIKLYKGKNQTLKIVYELKIIKYNSLSNQT